MCISMKFTQNWNLRVQVIPATALNALSETWESVNGTKINTHCQNILDLNYKMKKFFRLTGLEIWLSKGCINVLNMSFLSSTDITRINQFH